MKYQYSEVRDNLSKALKKTLWELGMNSREFVKSIKISRSSIMTILTDKDRAPRMNTLWAIIDHYGYNAIGADEFSPQGQPKITYEIAHSRMCHNIEAFIQKREITMRTFSNRSNFSVETLRHILKDDASPNLYTMWAIANTMGYERIGQLFDRIGW